MSRRSDFEAIVRRAVDALPPELQAAVSNVEFVVEEEPPRDEPDLLGLYEGIPLTERTGGYGFVSPDKITIFRGPLERLAAGNHDVLVEEVQRTVWHELAHHFGIDDDRLDDLDRY